VPAPSGQILFDGHDIAHLKGAALRRARGGMQMVFQDPYSSLSPRQTIQAMLDEAIAASGGSDRAERQQRSRELIERVGLSRSVLERNAHHLSGGQRQRVAIARALSVRPSLLICDEPVSALDVSVRAQIVNLLLDLRDEHLAILMIAHDLAVVRLLADHVAVMYLGRLVEVADTHELFERPLHPYTKALIASVPDPSPFVEHDLTSIEGEIPDPAHPPSGCRFRTRCPFQQQRCVEDDPGLRSIEGRHRAACHFAEELSSDGVAMPAATMGQPATDRSERSAAHDRRDRPHASP